MGKKFLSVKEASKRYGKSTAWFNKRRSQKLKPTYLQIVDHGTVMYPVDEVDSWFKEQIRIHVGS